LITYNEKRRVFCHTAINLTAGSRREVGSFASRHRESTREHRDFTSKRPVRVAVTSDPALRRERLMTAGNPIFKGKSRLLHGFEKDQACGAGILSRIMMAEGDPEFARKVSEPVASLRILRPSAAHDAGRVQPTATYIRQPMFR